jgi:hypothetical protein
MDKNSELWRELRVVLANPARAVKFLENLAAEIDIGLSVLSEMIIDPENQSDVIHDVTDFLQFLDPQNDKASDTLGWLMGYRAEDVLAVLLELSEDDKGPDTDTGLTEI